MSANDLLLWMSACGQGSWSQFRGAVERFNLAGTDSSPLPATDDDAADPHAFPAYHEVRLNLERLAYAEFFGAAREAEWRVAPPVLAVIRRSTDCLGLALGARSPQFVKRIQAATTSINVRVVGAPQCPDSIVVTAPDTDVLEAMASSNGLLLQDNAPLGILNAAAPIDSPRLRHSADVPLGSDWVIQQFDARELRWKKAARTDVVAASTGLFRLRFHHRTETLLKMKGSTYAISLQVGKYLVLKRRRTQVLRYDACNQRLALPAVCRPPLLVERALLLCSGRLPTYEARPASPGLLYYHQVPLTIARLAAALLRQELR